MKSRHLLSIKDLSIADINSILTKAEKFLCKKTRKKNSCSNKNIINLFFEDSTRTLTSFELAGKQLGASVINMSIATSSIKKGETLIDTAMTLNAMDPDILIVRHNMSGVPYLLSEKVNCSVINAGDGSNEHPTQALLDSYSLRKELGDLKNKNILIVGDILHSRVALSNIFALQLQGANITVSGPNTLIPKYLKDLGVKIEDDFDKALKWCDAANMLRLQNERMSESFFPSVREYKQYYGLTKKRLDKLNKDIVIMHPGPINRGIEITSEVADSKNSIILDQVENGVAIRMAVIYLLAKKNINH